MNRFSQKKYCVSGVHSQPYNNDRKQEKNNYFRENLRDREPFIIYTKLILHFVSPQFLHTIAVTDIQPKCILINCT